MGESSRIRPREVDIRSVRPAEPTGIRSGHGGIVGKGARDVDREDERGEGLLLVVQGDQR